MSDTKSGLPSDSHERKAAPVYSGVLKYFPDAICEVSRLSLAGNRKHNGDAAALHWAKEKSTDEDDALVRHMLNVAKGEVFDDESYPNQRIRHRAAVAWRALAGLQREIEAERAAINPQPEAPGALCACVHPIEYTPARGVWRCSGCDRPPARPFVK